MRRAQRGYSTGIFCKRKQLNSVKKRRNRVAAIENLEKRQLLAVDVMGEIESLGVPQHVAATDSRTGKGFLMFSEENVFTRFGDDPPYTSNANNILAVQYLNGIWGFDNNSFLVPFTPRESDLLIAEIDFTLDTIESLQGENSNYRGISKGYRSGDLTFRVNEWNGSYNVGEFDVDGTHFERNLSSLYGSEITIGSVGRGVAADDYRVGDGFILFSREDVFDRFADYPPHSKAARHLVVTSYDSGQWYYDDNGGPRPFEPRFDDILIAELDFSNDIVVNLEGQYGNANGIVYGYAAGDLTFTAEQYGGSSNEGEFDVEGTAIIPWTDVTVEPASISIEEDEF